MEKILFAAGCFWGVELAFKNQPGVKKVTVGYSGGNREKPTYKEVCSELTGHAEVALVEYAPQETSAKNLIDFFWTIHDPTTLNRQGPDIGTQYRSVIYYYTEEQKNFAEQSKKLAQQKYQKLIVTEILPATTFWPAEEYHQNYLEKNAKTCGI